MAGFVERLARYFNRAPALDRLGAMREKGAFRDDRDTGAAVAELADAMEALDDFAGTAPPSAGETTPRCARSAHSLACASASCAPSRRRCRGTRPGTPSRGGRRRMAELALEEAARALLGRVETAAGVDGGGFARRSPARAWRSASAPGRWAARRRRTRSGTSPPRGGAPRRAARAPTTSTLKRARVHYRVSLPTRIQTWIRATRRCGSPRRSRAPRTSPPRTTPRSPPGTGTCPASSPTR